MRHARRAGIVRRRGSAQIAGRIKIRGTFSAPKIRGTTSAPNQLDLSRLPPRVTGCGNNRGRPSRRRLLPSRRFYFFLEVGWGRARCVALPVSPSFVGVIAFDCLSASAARWSTTDEKSRCLGSPTAGSDRRMATARCSDGFGASRSVSVSTR